MPNARVLIVEDEPLISMMLENFLEILDKDHAGTAATVTDALSIMDQVTVDLAILDLNLANGESSEPIAIELARRGIPFVVASGGAVAPSDAFQGRPLLPKPFSLSDMEGALEAL